MEIEGRSSTYFAEDALIGILSRLPVKSLLRFKCVSKRWRALIQSSYFTALHLKQSDSNLLLISKTKQTEDENEFAMSLVCDEATPELNLDSSYLGCTVLPWCVSVVGSSNGLVCLLCNRDDPLIMGKIHRVVVWNPATKQFRYLTEIADDKSLLGFAFIDHDISDYKLVSINVANKESGNTIFGANVITRRTSSWREADIHCCSSAAFSYRKVFTITLNGVLYSLLWKRDHSAYSLLSFNFRDEVIDVMPLPESIGITEENFRTFLSWKNSLAFLIEKKVYELWVMTDEPSAGATHTSWVKQLILEPSSVPSYIHGSLKDEYLFGEDIYQELHCYNLESQRLIKLPQHDQKHRYFYDRVFSYVESLVSVV